MKKLSNTEVEKALLIKKACGCFPGKLCKLLKYIFRTLLNTASSLTNKKM